MKLILILLYIAIAVTWPIVLLITIGALAAIVIGFVVVLIGCGLVGLLCDNGYGGPRRQ